MVGGAQPGTPEPARMPMAAFELSGFDLKYGKFPLAESPRGQNSAWRKFRRLGLTPPPTELSFIPPAGE
jgi:hypothetical protein